MGTKKELEKVTEELRSLVEVDELDETQEKRFDELMVKAEELREAVKAEDAEVRSAERAEQRAAERAALAEAFRSGAADVSEGFSVPEGVSAHVKRDPYDTRSAPLGVGSASEVRGRAITAIEQTRAMGATAKQAAVRTVERFAEAPQVSRHILATGNPAYRSAFQKFAAGQDALLTDAEKSAVGEARAHSLTDAAGGFAVPFTLDPTIIDTRDGVTNPLRRIADVKQIVTDSWNGVSSAGMTASYDAEGSEVSDDAATLAQPSIPVHMARAFAPGSIEIMGDWAAAESDISMMIANARDDLEGTAMITGTGSGEPTGIVTALTGTASELSPSTAETFATEDLYLLENDLPPRYRLSTMDGNLQTARSSWLAARGTYNDIRQFGTSDGQALWTRLQAGLPPELIGYRAYEASVMDSSSDIDATATANNRVLVLGDFRNFVIVDRLGLSVEFIQTLFGANNRPTGQRGIFAYWRSGSDSVNDNAFRMLNVTTTA